MVEKQAKEISQQGEYVTELDKILADCWHKVSEAYDVLDATGVVNSDGTHPQLVERIKMLVDEVKSLREQQKPQTDAEVMRAVRELAADICDRQGFSDSAKSIRSGIPNASGIEFFIHGAMTDLLRELEKHNLIHAPVKRLSVEEVLVIAANCAYLTGNYHKDTLDKIRRGDDGYITVMVAKAIYAAIFGVEQPNLPTVEECEAALREHMKPWTRLEVQNLLDAIEREKGGA